ncbi:putative glycoside hydrolase [Orenia marismortui]|uniref:putative glycoside hydrolase n=1 Tax=Orenia marismortui TaxID=46469 RepID=UPI00037F5785|nr:putative glycoside hydrolase [Orenia marismortui]
MNSYKSVVLIILLICFFNSYDIYADDHIDNSFSVAEGLSFDKLDLDTDFLYRNKKIYKLDIQNLVSPHVSYSKNVKGIYINAWIATNEGKVNKLIEEIGESDLNAIVVDLKETTGRITFTKGKNEKKNLFENGLKVLIDKAHKKGIYVIGRLAVFKDSNLAKSNKNYALKYVLAEDGQTIINSDNWVDPFSEDIWKYNLDIAKKAAELGLDEIQFDYVRFPTLALNSKFIIRSKKNNSKVDAIVGFLKYAKKALKEYDVLTSADVFGLTTTVKGDLSIGQDITKLINYVDYLSPMIYPSHYNSGMYGVDNPDKNPYEIIFESLEDAKEKLGDDGHKLRPWLQDFSLRHRYTNKEVKEQIKAVKDNQLSGWLLWNPRSKYTISAVKSLEKGMNKRWNIQGSELFRKK